MCIAGNTRWRCSHQIPAPKGRYITDQWQHGPEWAFYGEGGEDWFGFKGVRALGDREPDILMIPLPGHTLGHCGIAVRTKDKWLLHAGDAYFFHGQLQAKPKMPLVLGLFQRRADMDRALRLAKSGTVADAEGHAWRCRDDLQQP